MSQSNVQGVFGTNGKPQGVIFIFPKIVIFIFLRVKKFNVIEKFFLQRFIWDYRKERISSTWSIGEAKGKTKPFVGKCGIDNYYILLLVPIT